MMGSGQEVTGYTDEELSATDPIYDLYIYNNSTGASMMMMAEDMSVYGIFPQRSIWNPFLRSWALLRIRGLPIR